LSASHAQPTTSPAILLRGLAFVHDFQIRARDNFQIALLNKKDPAPTPRQSKAPPASGDSHLEQPQVFFLLHTRRPREKSGHITSLKISGSPRRHARRATITR